MSPLRVPNFSRIGARIRVLWRILQSVRKEEVEEKNPKLWPLVSRKWQKRFSSKLECGLPYLSDTSVATLVSIGYGITELQRCENRVYFFPVIYSRCGAPASWASRHTTVCLDTFSYSNKNILYDFLCGLIT